MAGKVDKAKGRAKRAVGEATGNRQLKDRGTVDKAAGRAKGGISKAAEKTKKGMRRAS